MQTITALSFILALNGCALLGPSLEGDWEGEMDCGEGGTFDIEMEIERLQGNEYEGEGMTKGTICYADEIGNFECNFHFKMEIEAEGGMGEQEIDIDLDDCEVSYSGGRNDTECSADLDDVEWDGKDTIEFESGDCDGELERD